MGLGSKIRDPRIGIQKKPIPDPGSRGQNGTGSRIHLLDFFGTLTHSKSFLLKRSPVPAVNAKIRWPDNVRGLHFDNLPLLPIG
jgi:hypothetical protein